jgi:hypothetical protein
MKNTKEKTSLPHLVFFKRDTEKLDTSIEKRLGSIIKKYPYKDRIEICYQEMERLKDTSNLLLEERTLYYLYIVMVEAFSKLKITTREHNFIFKYAYIRCLISKIHNGLSPIEISINIKEPIEQHLKCKFNELYDHWSNMSPILQLLYDETLKSILKESISISQQAKSSPVFSGF